MSIIIISSLHEILTTFLKKKKKNSSVNSGSKKQTNHHSQINACMYSYNYDHQENFTDIHTYIYIEEQLSNLILFFIYKYKLRDINSSSKISHVYLCNINSSMDTMWYIYIYYIAPFAKLAHPLPSLLWHIYIAVDSSHIIMKKCRRSCGHKT